jgi:translation initiation factor 2 beta subunit (eIF-2beta)/eIF-5
MSLINIGQGHENDPNYRYKMPAAVLNQRGRHSGFRTVITNGTLIAKALHTKPLYLCKYLGAEFGAPAALDDIGAFVLRGAHTARSIAQHINKFIELFILCPKCRLPETTLYSDKHVRVVCNSCGYNETLRSAHKIMSIISTNSASSKPPPLITNFLTAAVESAGQEIWYSDFSDDAVEQRALEEMDDQDRLIQIFDKIFLKKNNDVDEILSATAAAMPEIKLYRGATPQLFALVKKKVFTRCGKHLVLVPRILYLLYMAEIIEEFDIRSYYEQVCRIVLSAGGSYKKLEKYMAILIHWLDTAEEE